MKLVLPLTLIILIVFQFADLPGALNPCRRSKARRQSGSEESDENDDCDRRTASSRAARRRNSRTFLGNSRESSSESRESSLFSITGLYKRDPWYMGPNVCKRNEVSTPSKAGSDRMQSLVKIYGQSCRTSSSSYRCSTMKIENGTAVKNVTVYECCLGFSRKFYRQHGCPEEQKLNSTEDTLQQLNLTRFLDSAKQAGLLEKMSPENNYTIFAPSNEAFDDSSNSDDIGFVTLETQDKLKFVRDILASHVLPQLVSSESFDDGAKWPTLKKDAVIKMAVADNFFRFFVTANCARVTKVDLPAKNAYIHVVDRLVPEATRSLLQMLGDDARFSTFVSLLDEETRKLLDDPDRYLTVLAFTDESVEKLPKTLQHKIKNKQSCMNDFAENHITENGICSVTLSRSKQFMSLNFQRLQFNVSSTDSPTGGKKTSAITVNGRRIIGRDRVAINGVLHVVDGPIFFSTNNDPLDVLADSEEYKQFAEALKISPPIVEFLSTYNDTIIFVPPQADIEKILATSDSARKNELLMNHVARISDAQPSTIETMTAQRFNVRQTRSSLTWFLLGEPRQYTIGCARSSEYKSACNSVIQLINKPLPLVTSNIMEHLRNNSELSDFTFLVEASGLDKTLTGSNDSFTIFAPDNRAMKKYVRPEQSDYLLQNRDSLKRFVQRHIARGSHCCNQFGGSGYFSSGLRSIDGSRLRTSGSESNRNLRVNSYSDLLSCDHQVANGVIHIVDMPLASVSAARRRSSSTFDVSSMSMEDLVESLDNVFNIDF